MTAKKMGNDRDGRYPLFFMQFQKGYVNPHREERVPVVRGLFRASWQEVR